MISLQMTFRAYKRFGLDSQSAYTLARKLATRERRMSIWNNLMYHFGQLALHNAIEAFGDDVTPISVAWSFTRDNPLFFIDSDEWPMPLPSDHPVFFEYGYENS